MTPKDKEAVIGLIALPFVQLLNLALWALKVWIAVKIVLWMVR
jgi:hypothetical protein